MSSEPSDIDFLDVLDEAWCRLDAASGRVVACNAVARGAGLAVGERLADLFEDGEALAEICRLLVGGPVGSDRTRPTTLLSGPAARAGGAWHGRCLVRLVLAAPDRLLAAVRPLPATDAGVALRRLRHAVEVLDRLAQRPPVESGGVERMAVWLAAAAGLDDCAVVDRRFDRPLVVRSVTSEALRQHVEGVLAELDGAAGLLGTELARRVAARHPTAESGRFVRIGRIPDGVRAALMLTRGGDGGSPSDERDRVLRIAAGLLETRSSVEPPGEERDMAVVVAGDAGTRGVLRSALELRGHPVVDASDAGTARTLLATDPSVGLLVVARERSVAWPLAEEALALSPSLRVLWCSADGETRAGELPATLADRAGVLEMPFLPQELERALLHLESRAGG